MLRVIRRRAARIGLSMDAFNRSVGADSHKAKIERDKADGLRAGVTGTPTFFVNGRLLKELDPVRLKTLIDAELSR